jgi:DNA modification methylase
MNKPILLNGDCLDLMPFIPDNYTDLTVTSPPYDSLRTYNNSLIWTFDIFKEIAKELYRITASGGVVVWVVGDATIDGSETGTSFKQALYFKELGFNLHDTMIYEKAGVAFPDTNRYYQLFEYMFVLSKGRPKNFFPLSDRKNKYAGSKVHSGSRQKDGSIKAKSGIGNIIPEYGVRYNIWRFAHVGKERSLHPATFPIEIPSDHIKTWTNEKDMVFDPFLGSGTTGVACRNLNRNFIGIEKDEKYFEIAKQRIECVTPNKEMNHGS